MKKEYYSYIGVYLFSLSAIGCLTPLVGQYLDSINYTGTQIGAITASATAIGILSAPIWSSLYERNHNDKLIYFFYCVAAFFMVILNFIHNYIFFLLLYVIAFSFEAPIRPLNDARLLMSKFTFGDIRLWGSIGFSIGIFVASQTVEFIGYSSIFYLYSISLLISCLFLRNLSKYEDQEVLIINKLTVKKISVYLMLHNKKFILLILSAFFINGTCIANNTYFSFLYLDSGGTILGLGIVFFLMVISEAPFMVVIEKLLKKISIENLILIAMLISLIRFYLYSMSIPYFCLIGTFFLQGIVNGSLWILFAKYIAKLTNSVNLSTSLTLYTVIASNTSTIFCQLLGGIILDKFGVAQIYLAFALLNCISIFIYIGSGLFKSKL